MSASHMEREIRAGRMYPDGTATTGYEVLAITLAGERVVESLDSMDAAFDLCCAKWAERKTGGPVFAVREAETDQRWSLRDIQELRAAGAA